MLTWWCVAATHGGYCQIDPDAQGVIAFGRRVACRPTYRPDARGASSHLGAPLRLLPIKSPGGTSTAGLGGGPFDGAYDETEDELAAMNAERSLLDDTVLAAPISKTTHVRCKSDVITRVIELAPERAPECVAGSPISLGPNRRNNLVALGPQRPAHRQHHSVHGAGSGVIASAISSTLPDLHRIIIEFPADTCRLGEGRQSPCRESGS
jgi:hypothetical protein